MNWLTASIVFWLSCDCFSSASSRCCSTSICPRSVATSFCAFSRSTAMSAPLLREARESWSSASCSALPRCCCSAASLARSALAVSTSFLRSVRSAAMSWRICSPSCAVVTQAEVASSAAKSSRFIGDPEEACGDLTAPAQAVKEGELFPPPHPLELVLAAERSRLAARGFLVHQRQRAAAARIAGAASAAMGAEVLAEVVGDAGIERAVSAAEEVDAPAHGGSMADPRGRRKNPAHEDLQAHPARLRRRPAAARGTVPRARHRHGRQAAPASP